MHSLAPKNWFQNDIEIQIRHVSPPSKYYSNGSPTEDTEDCLGRITVGLTRSKSLTLLVSPLDMMGLMGREEKRHGACQNLTLTQSKRI